jgi:DNA-binding GntR family transcriptional regulator
MKNISSVISGHKTLREKIVEVLRETIIRQKISPGERITELEIAERFGISRTPIREAFRQLESEGFLTIIPRKGAVVSDIKEQDIRDFYEIKGVLEGYAARQAVKRMTDKDIVRLEQLNQEIRDCAARQDVAGMTQAHNAFHNLILEGCGNRKIQQVVSGLVRQFLRFRFYVASLVHVDAILQEHSEIVAAIKARDADRAEACMVKNAQLGLNVLLKEFAGEESAPGD